MRILNFIYIFGFVFIAEMIIQLLNLQEYNIFIKPLIVPSLAAFYFQMVISKNKFFVLALFFCWVGDMFLLFDHVNEIYFIGGLGSFLLAHVFLIFLYGNLKLTQGSGFNGPQKARVSFPVILAGTGLIVVLYPGLGGLKIPVIIYAMVLMIMVLQSIYRYGFTSSQSFWNVLGGAVFFMLSDSILAINKFLQPIANVGVLVIATYMAALYFIVQGVIGHNRTQN